MTTILCIFSVFLLTFLYMICILDITHSKAISRHGQQGMSAHNISTSSPPKRGTCSITPSNGTSLKTVFNLSCSDWESESTPLSYLFRYQLQNGLHGLLYYGSSSDINSSLPSGKLSWNYTVKFDVTVTDKNGVSAPRVHFSVQVQYILDYY